MWYCNMTDIFAGFLCSCHIYIYVIIAFSLGSLCAFFCFYFLYMPIELTRIYLLFGLLNICALPIFHEI